MISTEHPLALLPLRALALLYGVVVRLRNRYYDRPTSPRRARVPVVSVGNLTVGGTGKTPLVAWLARRLLHGGHHPAIVSRGYGGRVGSGPVVLSTGTGPERSAAECGDEPYLLATVLRGIPVVVGSNRTAGAATAAGLGSDIVILDDGFQHRRLARALDIVLLEADRPLGNGRLLPAGPLREPPSALARADLVLITRSRRDDADGELERLVRSYNVDAPIVRASHRRVGFFDPAGRPAAPPRAAVVFCAIGNPGGFRRDLEAEGVEITAFETRRDHHAYAATELRRLRSRAAALDVALVTTEKDLVRLPTTDLDAEGPPLLALRIEAEPFDTAPIDAALREALRGGPRP